jgi:hypothetical protein
MGLSGGAKLKAFLDKLTKSVGEGQKVVRVGFLENSTAGINNDASAPEVAFILDRGAPAANIPPRPFFRQFIEKRHVSWGGTLEAFLKKNHYNARLALLGTGLVMGEQLQLEITELTEPRNKDWAVKAKGHTKPLEWSKNMKRAVAAEIDDERVPVDSSSDSAGSK